MASPNSLGLLLLPRRVSVEAFWGMKVELRSIKLLFLILSGTKPLWWDNLPRGWHLD